jgi:PAS domain S-box-containing protein
MDDHEHAVEGAGADARFRALADNLPDLVARFDRGLRHVFVNRAVLRGTGLGREAFLGRTHHEIPAVPPDAAARWTAELSAVFADGAERAFEFSWPTPGGETRWFDARVVAEPGPGGGTETVLAVARDVTRARGAAAERSAAAAARQEGERRLATLLGNLPGMAYRCGNAPHWPMEFVSAGSLALTGHSPEDLVGGRVAYADLILPEDRSMVWSAVQEAVAQGGRFQLRYRIRAADGRTRWVSEQGRGVSGADGRVAALEGFVQDVTAVVLAEEALRERGDRLRRLVESLPMGAVYVEGEHLEMNPAVERLTGYSRHEIPTVSAWFRALFGDDAAAVQANYDADRARGLGETRVISVRRKDGATRVVEFGGVAGAAAGGEFAVWVLQDVTERVQLEAQLRQAQKLEAVGQLAGGVAHDFNNLLTVIGGTASFLAERLAPDAPEREDVEEIARAVERGASLTRQLLAFGRRQPLSLRAVDVRAAVAGVERMLRRAVGERVELDVRAAGDPCWAWADPAAIEQVVVNLALNARDAMPAGGVVVVDVVAAREQAAATAEPPAAAGDASATDGTARPGAYVVLRVADTGTGMSPEVLQRAFEPFFTTKAVGRGTGLGLAVVHGIAEQSGGFVRVRSAPGQGTTVEVFLPECEPPEAPAAGSPGRDAAPGPGAPGARSAAANGGATILLAEDQRAVRFVARRALEGAGYRVIDAADGAAALRLWRERAGAVDLVLTDVVMPEMDGAALARAIRAERPEVPIVFMSGYDSAADGGVPLPSGAALVAKPFEVGALLAAVRAALGAAR